MPDVTDEFTFAEDSPVDREGYVVSEEERASEAASDRPAKGKPSKGQSRRRR
jgi:hypothetical protein